MISVGGTVIIGGSDGIASSTLTTNGDLLTRAAGVPARLGVGTEAQVLAVVGGACVGCGGGRGAH